MLKKLTCFAVCLVAAGALSSTWGAPTVTDKGNAVVVANSAGPRGSIAVDSADNPHIVMTDAPGSGFSFSDFNGSGFNTANYNSSAIYNSPLFGSAHMEIDANDMAWISATFWWPNMGIGIVVRPNVKTKPTAYPSFNGGDVWDPAFDVGNLSIDPGNLDSAFFSSHRGVWERYDWVNNAAHDMGGGELHAGAGGEKAFFYISKAGDVPHPDGTTAAVKTHCTEYSFNNSLRAASGLGWYKWSSWDAYPGMLTDHAYPACTADAVDPLVSYFAAEYDFAAPEGIYMNVWRGTDAKGNGDCVFPSTALLCIDPHGRTGVGGRYEPQIYPANGGGCWIAWIRDGRAKLRFVPADITAAGRLNDCGAEIDVCAASVVSTICVDKDGSIHMVYKAGSEIMYRKLTVSGDKASQASSRYLAGDYNGDGLDDLCVYYGDVGYWNIAYNNVDANLAFAKQDHFLWGNGDMIPVPADYDGDGATDVAVYYPDGGWWLVMGHPELSYNWGWSGAIPVPADYDGDRKADRAVYSPENGYWLIWGSEAGKMSMLYGFDGAVPVPGDYDGNGRDDIALYITESGNWQAFDILGNKFVEGYSPDSRSQWGWGEVRPVPADYDGDGAIDRAVYFSGSWHIWGSTDGDLGVKTLGGGENEIPVPGVYYNKYLKGGRLIERSQIATYLPEYGLWQLKDIYETWTLNKTFGWADALPPSYKK